MRIKFKIYSVVLFLTVAGLALASEVKIIRDVPSTFVYPVSGHIPFDIHRGTQTLLSLMVHGASFNDPQGIACALLNTDHDPNSPLNDVVVTCVGVNSGEGEIFYNVGLKDIRRFGSPGSGEKQFLAPTGIAINADGDVAVADTGNNRIVFLKHDGLRMTWVKAVGRRGKRAGEFEAPMGVAFDTQGRLYIADAGNDRIQVMGSDGKFKILDTPALDKPFSLAVIDSQEEWTFYKVAPYGDRLAVIDQKGTRLRTLTLEGAPLAQTTADQWSDPPAKLWGCAFDYFGNLVATDSDKSCLRKFDKDLHYLVSFGTPGTEDYQFLEPRGIAINHQFGQLFVVDKEDVQYFWNGADAVSIKVTEEAGKVRIPFFLTERALVTADIETDNGTVLQSLTKNQELEEGAEELDWDPQGKVNSGNYSLKMQIMATYSSREHIAKEITQSFDYFK